MQRIRLNVKKYLLPILLIVAIIVLDQISKIWVEKNQINQALIPNLLSFIYTKNTGAAFSFLGNKSWAQTFFIVLTSAALIMFTIIYIKTPVQKKLLRLSLLLIIAGACGNFIDRLNYGYVVDFISIHFFPAIFNVADIALTFGAVMFIVHFLFLDSDAVFKGKKSNNE